MTEHYNRAEQKENRRRLRRSLSKSEAILWKKLSRRQIAGHKFRRQFGVDQYKIDFYCPELKLAIEVDGDLHHEPAAQERDRKRQEHIEEFGVTFLRIPSLEVCTNIDGVVQQILQTVETLEKSKKALITTPTPPC